MENKNSSKVSYSIPAGQQDMHAKDKSIHETGDAVIDGFKSFVSTWSLLKPNRFFFQVMVTWKAGIEQETSMQCLSLAMMGMLLIHAFLIPQTPDVAWEKIALWMTSLALCRVLPSAREVRSPLLYQVLSDDCQRETPKETYLLPRNNTKAAKLKGSKTSKVV